MLLASALFWGDPHIRTIDGIAYTFNGWGEYTLLEVRNKSDNSLQLGVQARTDRVIDSTGNYTEATIFTAFAARDFQSSSSVHIELNGNKDGKTIPFRLTYSAFLENKLTTAYK